MQWRLRNTSVCRKPRVRLRRSRQLRRTQLAATGSESCLVFVRRIRHRCLLHLPTNPSALLQTRLNFIPSVAARVLVSFCDEAESVPDGDLVREGLCVMKCVKASV